MKRKGVLSLITGIVMMLTLVVCPQMDFGAKASAAAVSSKTVDEAFAWLASVKNTQVEAADPTAYAQCVDLTMKYADYLGLNRISENDANTYADSSKTVAGWERIEGCTAPQKGDVLVYKDANHGHVAIYESEFVTWHQNFPYYGENDPYNKPYVTRVDSFTNKKNQTMTPRFDSSIFGAYWGVWRPNFKSSAAVNPSQGIGSNDVRYCVLVLDSSGSMSGTPCRVQKEAAKKFCESIFTAEGTNKVGIIKFSNSSEVICDFTSDFNVLSAAIDSISASGGTNYDGALNMAAEMINKAPAGAIKNIVFCSDGLPEHGTKMPVGHYDNGALLGYYDRANSAFSAAERIKARGDCSLYALGFFHSLSNDYLPHGEMLMRDLSSNNGSEEGDYYHIITDSSDLVFTFGAVAGNITGPEQGVSYHLIRINCDVDVKVYDSSNNLVASIINEVPNKASVVQINSNGEKIVRLPIDTDYTVKITARENTFVNCHVDEYYGNTMSYTRAVDFSEVYLEKGQELTAVLPAYSNVEIAEGTPNGSAVVYKLITPDGSNVTSSEENRSCKVNVNVSDPKAGTAKAGNSTVQKGAFVRVTASARSGHEFTGWYIGNTRVSSSKEYRFKVTDNVTVTASFDGKLAAASVHVHSYGSEWKSDSRGHWQVCTGCGAASAVTAHTEGQSYIRTNSVNGADEEVFPCKDCGYVMRTKTPDYWVYQEDARPHAYVYCYTSDMERIKIVSNHKFAKDSDKVTVDIALGDGYAGKTAVLYNGKKSTSSAVEKVTLGSGGSCSVEVKYGKNYTLVVEG